MRKKNDPAINLSVLVVVSAIFLKALPALLILGAIVLLIRKQK